MICLGDVPGVWRSLYPDDGALWVVGQDANCCGKIMQEAIYSLEQWSHTWGLHISPEKTVAMLFNRKIESPCPPPLLGGTQLEYVGLHKFLGMTLDIKLSWSKHILSLSVRCCKYLRI